MTERHVLIAGGGASGLLLAAALLRAGADFRVSIIEPRGRLGVGVAYSTDCPAHVLNVPAGRMSAFPDDPDHFLRWLAQHCRTEYGAMSFVPRQRYGEYLESIARETIASAGDRLSVLATIVVDAESRERGVRVVCADGRTVEGDALVIATGNALPAPWPNIAPDALASGRCFRSAWEPGALVPEDPETTVLLLGTGLTAVDAVLGLRRHGHQGTIVMLSRRGLLPHEQRLFDVPPESLPPANSIRELTLALRASSKQARLSFNNWRIAIDGVRPQTNALWQALSLADKRRFLRHVMPYWNVHRHRMAPEVAQKIASELADGTLRMIAGRTERITAAARALCVPVRPRGNAERIVINAGRVINCSGPEHDFRKLENPLIERLLAQGIMVPHVLNIGVAVAPDGALIDARGEPSATVYAIGPVRYGTLIETIAMPEVRVQARELADTLDERLPRKSGIETVRSSEPLSEPAI